jgi:ABC-type sugar transport system substrate-binding protein
MPRLRYLISLVTKDNDYQREQATAAEQLARELDVDVEIRFANSDAITQSQQLLEVLQSARKAEFAGFILEPAGGTSMTQVGREAVRNQIAWVVLNRDIDGFEDLRRGAKVPVFVVSSDHEEVGRIQGRQCAALLPRGGNVLYLHGPATSQVAQRRAAGMQSTKPSNVTTKILRCASWTETSGHQATSSWLKLMIASKDQVDLIVAQNDFLASGARKAFREVAGDIGGERWGGLRFTGVDGLSKTGQTWVRDGILAATIVLPPNTAPALKMLVKAVRQNWQPPDRTLVAPYSFPEVTQLSSNLTAA